VFQIRDRGLRDSLAEYRAKRAKDIVWILRSFGYGD
jgi:hypothetical protein